MQNHPSIVGRLLSLFRPDDHPRSIEGRPAASREPDAREIADYAERQDDRGIIDAATRRKPDGT